MAATSYLAIKRAIADEIALGKWNAGDVLPSEPALCRIFGVSRMTANRAMRELATENLVRRVPGVGSFVAEPAPQSSLVEIRSIADEIFARGHCHRAEVKLLNAVAAPPGLAALLDVQAGAPLFHSTILHFENEMPLQLEDRFVNPAAAPGYLDQDFAAITPNEFLSRVAPLRQAEHIVQAIAASSEIAAWLAIETGGPCLLVSRRTWSGKMLASLARLYHPGNRFRLGGTFVPPSAEGASA